ICVAPTGRPRQHCVGKFDAERVAQQPQHSLGIAHYIISVDHWRSRTRVSPDKIENLGLLHKTEVVQFRLGVLLDVGGDYFRGIASWRSRYFAVPTTSRSP